MCIGLWCDAERRLFPRASCSCMFAVQQGGLHMRVCMLAYEHTIKQRNTQCFLIQVFILYQEIAGISLRLISWYSG